MTAPGLDSSAAGSSAAGDRATKIGGFLHVLAFILILNPLRILYVIFNVAMPSYESAPPMAISRLDMPANLVFLLYSIAVIYFFFRRHRRTPALVIVLFFLNIAFVALNGTLSQWIPLKEQHGADTWRVVEFVAAAAWFLFWTLYLVSSKRVRATFSS